MATNPTLPGPAPARRTPSKWWSGVRTPAHRLRPHFLRSQVNGWPPVYDDCIDLADEVVENFPIVVGVTGKPVTHLLDLVEGHVVALNEKTAVETAVGATLAGERCCVVIKHNGLGCALDSLANAAVHTTGKALVIIVGDDPDATSSTSAVDSRALAKAASIPVFEPTLLEDCRIVLRSAIKASERLHTPVIVRVTAALHAGCSPNARCGSRELGRLHQGEPVDRTDVAHGLTKFGRVQSQRMVTLPGVVAVTRDVAVEQRCRGHCKSGLIVSGAAARHLPADAGCVMIVRRTWPLPDAAVAFANQHDSVLVIEDSAPVIEESVRAGSWRPHSVRGRLSGHLPSDGTLNTAGVSAALAGGQRVQPSAPERKLGTPPPLGEFEPVFKAVAALRRAGAVVATDVGSSVRLCYPPYDGADAAIALGSAGAVASGAARAGRLAIAVMGDYALLHSGIQSILEAQIDRLPVVFVILRNGVQAQTGGQPVPTVDIGALIRGCGVELIDEWSLDEYDAQIVQTRLQVLLDHGAPAVAIVQSQRREP